MSEGFFYVEWVGEPCPFCGEDGVSGKSPESHFFAGCPDADCLAHNLAYDFVTVAHARAAWNNRAAQPSLEVQTDGLVSLLNDRVWGFRHGARTAYDQDDAVIDETTIAAIEALERDKASLQRSNADIRGERDAARELLVIAAKRQAADDQRIRELEGLLRKALSHSSDADSKALSSHNREGSK